MLPGTCAHSAGLIAAINSGTVFSMSLTLPDFLGFCYPRELLPFLKKEQSMTAITVCSGFKASLRKY
jgi:hypothetical protein